MESKTCWFSSGVLRCKTNSCFTQTSELTRPSLFSLRDFCEFLSSMANQQHSSSRSWTLDGGPLLAVFLIAAHVIALVYWIYKLATQKPPPRRKIH